ncbi:Uma2 family endonuclease [Peterkaempfera sp. SMS 1(5)a]|uniref:Uma2 family endonuclease n=1 Tax=Peterkaempfera podocarpi TaxID=3232308 RepID=UPI00366D7EFF
MTVVDDRLTRVFAQLDVPEGVKAELIRGEIVMMAGPDLVHNWIIESVQDQIPRTRWHRVQTQDIAIPAEASEPQPDLVVFERGAVEGPGRLIPSEAVTAVVEVVSRTSSGRDYRDKREIYGAGGVPVYLIVDPIEARCVLLTEPLPRGESGPGGYRTERTSKFGEPVPIPELDLTLDTGEFQTISAAP